MSPLHSKVILKGNSGDAGGNKQLPQPLQREAMPPQCVPTGAMDLFWLRGPAKSVATGYKKAALIVNPTLSTVSPT